MISLWQGEPREKWRICAGNMKFLSNESIKYARSHIARRRKCVTQRGENSIAPSSYPEISWLVKILRAGTSFTAIRILIIYVTCFLITLKLFSHVFNI